MIQLLKVYKQFHYTVLKRMNYEYVIMYQIINYHEYHVCSKLPVVLFWWFSNKQTHTHMTKFFMLTNHDQQPKPVMFTHKLKFILLPQLVYIS